MAVSAVVVRVDECDGVARVELALQRNWLKRLDRRCGRRREDATAGASRPYPWIIDQAAGKNRLGLLSGLCRKRTPHPCIRLLGHPEVAAHFNSRDPSTGLLRGPSLSLPDGTPYRDRNQCSESMTSMSRKRGAQGPGRGWRHFTISP